MYNARQKDVVQAKSSFILASHMSCSGIPYLIVDGIR